MYNTNRYERIYYFLLLKLEKLKKFLIYTYTYIAMYSINHCMVKF